MQPTPQVSTRGWHSMACTHTMFPGGSNRSPSRLTPLPPLVHVPACLKTQQQTARCPSWGPSSEGTGGPVPSRVPQAGAASHKSYAPLSVCPSHLQQNLVCCLQLGPWAQIIRQIIALQVHDTATQAIGAPGEPPKPAPGSQKNGVKDLPATSGACVLCCPHCQKPSGCHVPHGSSCWQV